MTKIRFQGREFTLDLSRSYPNGMRAVVLEGEGPWDRVKASVAVDAPLGPGEVAIKDYFENEGVLAALIAAGVVCAPHRTVPSGMVDVPVCYLA
ncbi:hypothetical protein [Deinococcus soli (ex Cha et al. 2016)]|uniref:Uncharacterized protein n=2 Tax=Deinococcus soli (ex Cha et al. 2016) TaxID=1309411 RepID=A0AAE3XB59_9DEIO|nr:hypothetical protein [Deinococcus soli (ex Cha et al. 2016)]MDR6218535.1 hypothetical protein [Deinococcus soli (ex Cha et al. 2016)]MDR6329275.1 hypothetical protein [Deinococcus soli (ex Cha et al. 2016)]MDR6751548.1 hypothetical protein [Deinococcus soli (ex Cha et al. 2016)]